MGHPDDHTTGKDAARIECLGKAIMDAKLDAHRHSHPNCVIEMATGLICWGHWLEVQEALMFDGGEIYVAGEKIKIIHIFCTVEPNGLTIWNKEPRRK